MLLLADQLQKMVDSKIFAETVGYFGALSGGVPFARCSALAKRNLFFSPEIVVVATATSFYKQSTGSGRLGIEMIIPAAN